MALESKLSEAKKEKYLSDAASVVEDAKNFLSVSTGSVDDAWILDLGCVYHICPNRDWLTYWLFNGGIILIGNNTSYKIVGIETVQIKSHDGTVRTLSNVQHILDLKKNIFFLWVS